jgi:hypothetical protein
VCSDAHRQVNKVKTVSKDSPSTAEEVAAMVRGPTGTDVEVKMEDAGKEVTLSMQRCAPAPAPRPKLPPSALTRAPHAPPGPR